MFFKISDDIALRKWRYVDRAIYYKKEDHALSISKEDFNLLLLCDGHHDLEPNDHLNHLVEHGLIKECKKGEEPLEWSKLKEYDNYYFPRMNLMITGKCNLN